MEKGDKIYCKDNEYILEKLCGNGGKGIVYKAYSNEKYFAIKFLNNNANSKDKERFENEIKIIKKCRHPNIVSYVGDGIFTDEKNNSKHKFYIMPYYEKTFKDIIENEKDYNKILDYLCNCVKL